MKINQCQNKKCGSSNTAVHNTRNWNDRTRRTRVCLDCGTRWYTKEIIQGSHLYTADELGLDGLINITIDSLRKKSAELKKDID